jgi:hypothetical protein
VEIAMNIGPAPLIAAGTLFGNLPTGAGARTLGAPARASGQSFIPVGLDESQAVTGLTLTPYATPQVSADNPNATLMQQQLLALQEQNQS